MTLKTKAVLQSEYASFLPDNSTGSISPQDIRDRFVDTSDSYVHSGDVRAEVLTANSLTQNLADAATVNWDAASGTTGMLAIGGNRTVAYPTNTEAGMDLTLVVTQDATGSRTITWNGNYYWAGGTAPTLSTAANSVDILRFKVLTISSGLRAVHMDTVLDVQTSGGGTGPVGGG